MRRRRVGKALKIVAGVLLTLGVGAIGGVLVLTRTSLGQVFVMEQVLRRLEGTLNGEIVISGLRSPGLHRAATLLGEASTSAVQTLTALLDAPSVQAQLGAARAILEHGGRMRESVELAARISTLEEQNDTTAYKASRVA